MVKVDTSQFPITFPVESFNAILHPIFFGPLFPGSLFLRTVFKVAILTSSVATQNEIIICRLSTYCKNGTVCPCGIIQITFNCFLEGKTFWVVKRA